ncbi:MAG: hypothetical protein WCO23_03670 [bacterium]
MKYRVRLFLALSIVLLFVPVATQAFVPSPQLVWCRKDNYGQAVMPPLPMNFRGEFIAPPGISVLPVILWSAPICINQKMQISAIQIDGINNAGCSASTAGPITSWDTNTVGKFLFYGIVYNERTKSNPTRVIWNVSARLTTMVDGGLIFCDSQGRLFPMINGNIQVNPGRQIVIKPIYNTEPVNIAIKDMATTCFPSRLSTGTHTVYMRTPDGRVGREYKLTIK